MCISQFFTKPRYSASSSASGNIKPALQSWAPVYFLTIHSNVLRRGYGKVTYTSNRVLVQCELEASTGLSPHMNLYLDMVNFFWKGKKLGIRHPIEIFASWIICLWGAILAVRLWRERTGFHGKVTVYNTVLQRNEHRSVLLCVLWSFPRDPDSFIVMNLSSPVTYSDCPSLH